MVVNFRMRSMLLQIISGKVRSVAAGVAHVCGITQRLSSSSAITAHVYLYHRAPSPHKRTFQGP